MKQSGIIILLLCLLTGCNKTKPQQPSRPNDEHKADTTLLALIQCNQRMAEEADRQVIAYVKKQDIQFAQTEIGTWVHFTRLSNDTITPQKDEHWTIRLIVKDLSEKMIEDTEKTYTIQREELPRGIEDIIAEMHHGDEAILIAPWYDAYGQQGKAGIKPYTNLKFEIYIR